MKQLSFKLRKIFAIAAVLVLLGATQGYAGVTITPMQVQSVSIPIGPLSNNTVAYAKLYTQSVASNGGSWIRLHFTDVSLGLGSFIEIVGSDGSSQALDGSSIVAWNYYSAEFLGTQATVNLWVAPYDANVQLTIDEVLSGQANQTGSTPTTCQGGVRTHFPPGGPIARILIIDPRAEILDPADGIPNTTDSVHLWATAFITPNGTFVTAGHVFLEYQLSDRAHGEVQFDVPLSNANDGTPGTVSPQTTYPISMAPPGSNGLMGTVNASYNMYHTVDDWAVFGVSIGSDQMPISTWGVQEWEQYNGVPLPPSGSNSNSYVIGYGVDYTSNLYNQTQQLSWGNISANGSDQIVFNDYVTPGNSGSPIISSANNYALGIVIGDCFSGSTGASFLGTSFNSAPFYAALVPTSATMTINQVENVTADGHKIRLRTPQYEYNVGSVRLWNQSTNHWGSAVPAPAVFQFSNSPTNLPTPTQTFLADGGHYDDDNDASTGSTAQIKFHDWNEGSIYTLNGTFSTVTGNQYADYLLVAQNETIKAEFQSSPGVAVTDSGSIYFRDPWFDDTYNNSLYDQTNPDLLMNEGITGATFYQRLSPFHPNLSTPYSTAANIPAAYEGVFLGQTVSGNSINPTPYYSVRAPLTQSFSGIGTVYFDHWEAWLNNSQAGASFQDVSTDDATGYDTKAVVFSSDGVTIKAIYLPLTNYTSQTFSSNTTLTHAHITGVTTIASGSTVTIAANSTSYLDGTITMAGGTLDVEGTLIVASGTQRVLGQIVVGTNGLIYGNDQFSPSPQISYPAGWDMVSVPIDFTNFSISALYPSLTGGSAYTFANGYFVQANPLNTGAGYWMEIPSQTTLIPQYLGNCLSSLTINLSAGWNMVGSLSSNLDESLAQFVNTSPTSDFFAHGSSGYVPTETIEAGQGYWIKVSQAGQLFLSAQNTPTQPPESCTPPPPSPNGEPAAPTLASPANNSTSEPLSVTLRWNASTGATTYTLQISSASWKQTYSSISGTSYTVSGLAYSTAYSWQVNAANANGTSYWSCPWTFTTAAQSGGGCTSCCASSVESLDQLTIADNAGNRQVLYAVNAGRPLHLKYKGYDMPPAAMGDAFDARFKSNKWMESVANNNSQIDLPIVVKHEKYPLTLRWKLSAINTIDYWINFPGSRGRVHLNGQTGTLTINQGDINGGTLSLQGVTPDRTCGGGGGQEETATANHPNELQSAPKPKAFALHQNMPNPFNPTTVINYDLPVDSRVTLKVYNLLGQEVRTLVDAYESAGFKSVTLDASNLASGVYIYRLQAGSYNAVKKLVVMK